jgi:hypothetical protein
MKDLVVLVPGKDEESAVKGILTRHASLAIKKVDPTIFIHPGKDSGCLLNGSEFLRPFTKQYAHALIMLDREGCGRETRTREELEIQIEDHLKRSGWDDRAASIVIDPELEIWIWTESPHVPKALGWETDMHSLMKWLIDNRFLSAGERKPKHPKEAMEKILRMKKKPRSSAIYLELAKKVSLQRCQDPAFLKLKKKLVSWFSA